MTTHDEPPREVYPPFVRPYYPRPLRVARAMGTSIWDQDGKVYLDCYAGVSTVALGHCHERVNRAVLEQMETYGHVSSIYASEKVDLYAASLLAACGQGLERIFFVNSGSEAVDLAISLARVHSGSDQVLALKDGYHGGTHLSKSATGIETWHFKGEQARGILHIMTPKCSGCTFGATCQPPDQAPCVVEMETRVESIRARGARPILILEPILGVGGIIIPPDFYFSRIKEILARSSGILILDEVQTGFGRCGHDLFRYQNLGLQPDIVALGKGIANGYPLGAVVMSKAIGDSNGDLLHFNTFGGHPLSVAAARVTLDCLQDKGFLRTIAIRGERFREVLQSQLGSHQLVKEIRGKGLMIGLEISDSQAAKTVMEKCFAEGLLIGLGGRSRNVLRLQPPLIFSDEECDTSVRILGKALDIR